MLDITIGKHAKLKSKKCKNSRKQPSTIDNTLTFKLSLNNLVLAIN